MLVWLLGACFGVALANNDKLIMTVSVITTLSMWLYGIIGGTDGGNN